MTYNLLTGGRDGLQVSRREQLAAVIEQQAPDILALQECNGFDLDDWEVFHWFERRLNMRGLLGKADSGFHVALFTRDLPVLSHRVINGWCQHAMLRVRLMVEDEELEVTCVHHNPFSGSCRLVEAEFLAGQSRPEQLQLLLGDFNAVSPLDAARVKLEDQPARIVARHSYEVGSARVLDTRSLSALLQAEYQDLFLQVNDDWEHSVPTSLVAPKKRWRMRLDYALGSAALAERCTRCAFVRNAVADVASDHFPLVVDWSR